jgi:hypothetical protein
LRIALNFSEIRITQYASRKGFSFDLSEIEPAVVAHEIEDRIELLVNELRIVADNCNTEHGDTFAVLMVHFRYRDIESALEPPGEAFDNAPLALERSYPMQR